MAPTFVEARLIDVARPGGECWFTAARAVLLGMVMSAPLAFGAVEPWAWAAMSVLAGSALLLWAAECAATKRICIQLSPLYVPLLGAVVLLIWQLLSGSSADPIGTREALIKFASYCLIFFLTRQLLGNADEMLWRRMGVALTVYLFLISLFAIVQFFSSPGLLYWSIKPRWGGYIFGPYVNHNHYAGLIELVLPLEVAGLLGLPPRHGFRAFGVFAAAIGVASVLLCGSRGGAIGLALEMVIFLSVTVMVSRARWEGALKSGLPETSKRAVAAIALGLAVVVLAAFAWLDDGAVLKRWKGDAPELAAEGRKTIATDGIKMWKDFPVAGVGAGAFGTVYPQYQSWVTDNDVEHAHNDYVELLADTGAIGALLAFASIVLVLRSGLAGVWRRREWNSEHWMKLGSPIGACGILVHSFSDFNLHIPANAAWAAVLFGIVTCGAKSTGSTVSTPSVRRVMN